MDILLRKKYSYDVSDSFANEKRKLQTTLETKFYDLSKSVSGDMHTDGTFTFNYNLIPLWRFNLVRFVYLKGQILETEKGSKINATISPNIFLVLLLYILPLLNLNILFGDNTLMGSDTSRLNNLILLILIEITLLLIIQIISYVLKLKFEKTLRLGKFALKNVSGSQLATSK